ncbi:MAG: AAA family ATPase [Candidatus Riflebacteria bacterium]|nr:AAA family ATPase [Candidatus Riflebacteria bacterium]
MKRIPYGVSNFKSLVKSGYVYVDKTGYIRKIENLNEKYIVFLRPRRFGKSLFLSLLEYYYDIKHAESFHSLFGNFDIGSNPTPLKNSFYILTMSFSGINTDTPESTRRGFSHNVYHALRRFCINYSLEINISEEKQASEMMDTFFSEVSGKIEKNIYLLIDEYDHFANELLGFNTKLFKESVSRNGFVRKFYEMLKEATKSGILDRIFITGVSPVTLDSMTSGFNIAKNRTRMLCLNEMMGFTDEEIAVLVQDSFSRQTEVIRSTEKLRVYYNGYMFHHNAKKRVYNSDMVLYYFNELQMTGEEPSDMIDRNVISDYSKIGNLFNIDGYNFDRMKLLSDIIEDNEMPTIITDQFNLEVPMNLNDFKSLLFYMGLLSIKRYDEISAEILLGVPNYVMKELYFGYFRSKLEEAGSFRVNSEKVSEAIREIAIYGSISKLVQLTEETLHRLSDRDFMRFDEKVVQAIMLTYLFETKIYFAKSEYPVEDGYIDIVLLKGLAGKPKYYAMIELKYISKTDYSDVIREEKLKQAKEQLMNYSKSDELKAFPNMRKWAAVFCKDKCVSLEEL